MVPSALACPNAHARSVGRLPAGPTWRQAVHKVLDVAAHEEAAVAVVFLAWNLQSAGTGRSLSACRAAAGGEAGYAHAQPECWQATE
jgi:hypothetical protein